MSAAYQPPSIETFRLMSGLTERAFGGPDALMSVGEFNALAAAVLARAQKQIALEVGEVEFARTDLSDAEQGVLEDAHMFAATGHMLNILIAKVAIGIGENLRQSVPNLERAVEHFDRMRRKQVQIFLGGEYRHRAVTETGP